MNPVRIATLLLTLFVTSLASAQEKPIPLSHVIGKYMSDDGKVIAIRKLADGKIVLRSNSGLAWQGTYEKNKLRLSVKPNANAMNPDLPAWARTRIEKEGGLEWKLNLDVSEEASGTRLKGELLPGQVDWKEISDPGTGQTIRQSAKVTGAPGTPIKLAYTKGPDWAIADTIVLSAKPDKVTAAGTSFEYVLFAYGPRLPSKRQSIKPLVLETDGISYMVLGASGDTMPQGDKDLMAAGWKEAKRGISAKDAETLDKEWGAVLLLARVDPNVMPGYRPFHIATATSGWFLDQGTAAARIWLWRELPNSPGEPTEHVFQGERFHAQVDVGPRFLSPNQNSVPLVVGVNGSWMRLDGSFNAVFDSAASTGSSIYRSPTIELVKDTDPRLPPGKEAVMLGGDLLLAAQPGDNVQVKLADDRQFLCSVPGVNVFVSGSDEGPWLGALRRAAKADGLPSDIDLRGSRGKTVQEVTDLMITHVAFKLRLQYLSPLVRFVQLCYGFTDAEMAKGDWVASNRVTLGDHAAALLLRDEFVLRMQPLVDALKLVKTDSEKLGYLETCKGELENPNSPISSLEFDDPDDPPDPAMKTPRWKLGDIYQSKLNAEAKARLLLAGFDEYRRMVLNAQKKAIEIPDGDIQGLLALTGDCFGPVVKSLTPKLMRPVVDAKGSTRWEQDGIARKEVKELATTWEAIKAQKEWKAIDREVAIAAATCALQAGGLLSKFVARIAALANIAMGLEATYSSLAATGQDAAKEAFALGSYKVLGSGRFEMVQQQKTPAWAVFVNLASLGLIATGDIPVLLGKTSAGTAVAEASSIAARVKQGGLATFQKLPDKEKAALILAGAAVERKAAQVGAEALQDNEKQIEQAVKQVSDELKARGGYKVQIEAPSAPKPGAPEPPTPEPVLPERQNVPESASPNPESPIDPGTTIAYPDYKFEIRVGKHRIQMTAAEMRAYRAKGGKIRLLPSGFPEKLGTWKYRDALFELGEQIGEGQLFGVFEEIGTPDVLKVCKWLASEDPGVPLYDEIKLAEQLLTDYGIEHIPVRMGPRPRPNETMWLRQAKLNPDYVIPHAGQLLNSNQREAVMTLMEKLYAAKLVAEDLKTNNIYLRPLGNDQWVAGILDVDRVCRWGQATESINFVFDVIESGECKLKCVIGGSTIEGKRLLTFEDFFKAQLEKGAWLQFAEDQAAKKIQFTSSVLDAEEVFKRFPFLKNRGDRIILKGRPGFTPKPPPLLQSLQEGFALLRVAGGLRLGVAW